MKVISSRVDLLCAHKGAEKWIAHIGLDDGKYIRRTYPTKELAEAWLLGMLDAEAEGVES